MMAAGPHVQEDQRPEVDDGQPVGIDRPARLLGHEVVHHAEEGGGQEEADRVVAVPPLGHGVLHPGEQAVGLGQADRHRQVVEDVQQGDRENKGQIEPVGHVDMRLAAAAQGFDIDREIGYPNQGDGDVQRPLEFGVFAALGDARYVGQRAQRHAAGPTPEGELGQPGEGQPGLAGALHDVVGGGEQGAAAETEDHQGGVDRTQPPEGQLGNIVIKERPSQFAGDVDADGHAEYRPYHRHDRELADDVVIILLGWQR